MLKETTLYSLDSKDRVRVWSIKQGNGSYLTTDGLLGGKMKDWVETKCQAKNVGRSNATTTETQASSEINNLIAKKLKENYFYTIEEARKNKKFLPMLAHKYEDHSKKLNYPYYSQPKLDGARAFAVYENGRVVLYSRTGREYTSCPHINLALTPLLSSQQHLIIDGELYNHELKADFEKLMSLIRKSKPTIQDLKESKEKIQFHVYDLFSQKALKLEFFRRIILVQQLKTEHIVPVETTLITDDTQRDSKYSEYVSLGYEGQMIRVKESLYKVDGRSSDLLKRKEFQDDEFEIVSIEEGSGNWSGRAKRVIIKLENGVECGCGIRGNYEFAENLLKNQEDYIGGRATVRYFERTSDGSLRFPVVTDINRHD